MPSTPSLALSYFNPRPPRGGRHVLGAGDRSRPLISIHALREEGDKVHFRRAAGVFYFNPRPPRGGRPSKSPDAATIEDISIHALREEGDPDR